MEIIECKHCQSNRVLNVQVKGSDMFYWSMEIEGKHTENTGYLPREFGVGGGDYLRMGICLACGQEQGEYPLPLTLFEQDEEE